jgi:hypothetical protein
MGEIRIANKILVGKAEGKRPIRRPDTIVSKDLSVSIFRVKW